MTAAGAADTGGRQARRSVRTIGAGPGLAWLLVVTGALGLVASFVITVDKIRLAENPDFRPSCSINPILSCTNVMRSAQASAFGFPNPLIGLAAYAASASRHSFHAVAGLWPWCAALAKAWQEPPYHSARGPA